MFTAIIIGIGIYVFFRHLPDFIQRAGSNHAGVSLILVFAALLSFFGGSASGIAMTFVAALIFRWLLPLAAPRNQNDPPEQSRLESFREYISDDGVDSGIAIIVGTLIPIIGMTIFYFTL